MTLQDEIKELRSAINCQWGTNECRVAIQNAARRYMKQNAFINENCSSCKELKTVQDRLKFLLQSKESEEKRILEEFQEQKKEKPSPVDLTKRLVQRYVNGPMKKKK